MVEKIIPHEAHKRVIVIHVAHALCTTPPHQQHHDEGANEDTTLFLTYVGVQLPMQDSHEASNAQQRHPHLSHQQRQQSGGGI